MPILSFLSSLVFYHTLIYLYDKFFRLSQTEKIKPVINKDIDNPNCHQGTVPGIPNGILAIIIIGELKGIILPQTATGLLGSLMATDISAIAKITSKVMGKLSDCASRMSSLTALPIAAYREE